MKINHLDAHDRLLHFKKQSDYISEGCRKCIENRPKAFEMFPFYIFVHARTDDDGVNKRLIWIPRLNKPKPQTNSMLFKAYPGTDSIKIIWQIPERSLWEQFEKGNLMESKEIIESIYLFEHDRKKLEQEEPDDLPEEKRIQIMEKVRLEKIFNDSLKRAT